MITLKYGQVSKALRALADKEQAKNLSRFFKTGPGQYGAGDRFLGIKVPCQREVMKQFKDLPLPEVQKLLASPWHEERLTALFILVWQFNNASKAEKTKIYRLYLKNLKFINNWDLVDLSAPNIIGAYLLDKPRDILYKLASSKHLWSRRVAILSTFAFIRADQYEDTLALAEKLLGDKHDLMHKAVGWMLRELGKRDVKTLKDFLDEEAAIMPRTALRYALEKFSPGERGYYLKLKDKKA